MKDVCIEFISSKTLSRHASDKLDYIMGNIRDDKIVVLESPLNVGEEKELIKETMKYVDSKFTGIEISTLGGGDNGIRSMLIGMLGGKKPGLTVIGPSKLIRQMKKDPNAIHLFARAR